MDFIYTKTTGKSFAAAVRNVNQEIARAGMKVLHTHDVQKTLAEKGLKIEPLKIIEFCSAKFAYEFLNINPDLGICLPCKINVSVRNKQTVVAGLRPTILPHLFPGVDLGGRPEEIDLIIKNIINNSTRL